MSPSAAKRLSNLSIAIALGGVCVAGCCQDSNDKSTPVEVFQQIPDFTVQIKSVTRANYGNSCWGTIYTFEHDGHLFISQYPNAMFHHPDCPCMKGLKKIEFENP